MLRAVLWCSAFLSRCRGADGNRCAQMAFSTTSTIMVSNINLYTAFTGRSRMRMISATFATVFAFALSFGGAHAQSEKPGVEKLYILSCGEGVAGDISL
jgi:hypothetical protein